MSAEDGHFFRPRPPASSDRGSLRVPEPEPCSFERAPTRWVVRPGRGFYCVRAPAARLRAGAEGVERWFRDLPHNRLGDRCLPGRARHLRTPTRLPLVAQVPVDRVGNPVQVVGGVCVGRRGQRRFRPGEPSFSGACPSTPRSRASACPPIRERNSGLLPSHLPEPGK